MKERSFVAGVAGELVRATWAAALERRPRLEKMPGSLPVLLAALVAFSEWRLYVAESLSLPGLENWAQHAVGMTLWAVLAVSVQRAVAARVRRARAKQGGTGGVRAEGSGDVGGRQPRGVRARAEADGELQAAVLDDVGEGEAGGGKGEGGRGAGDEDDGGGGVGAGWALGKEDEGWEEWRPVVGDSTAAKEEEEGHQRWGPRGARAATDGAAQVQPARGSALRFAEKSVLGALVFTTPDKAPTDEETVVALAEGLVPVTAEGVRGAFEQLSRVTEPLEGDLALVRTQVQRLFLEAAWLVGALEPGLLGQVHARAVREPILDLLPRPLATAVRDLCTVAVSLEAMEDAVLTRLDAHERAEQQRLRSAGRVRTDRRRAEEGTDLGTVAVLAPARAPGTGGAGAVRPAEAFGHGHALSLAGVQCWTCLRFGHRQRDCPNRPPGGAAGPGGGAGRGRGGTRAFGAAGPSGGRGRGGWGPRRGLGGRRAGGAGAGGAGGGGAVLAVEIATEADEEAAQCFGCQGAGHRRYSLGVDGQLHVTCPERLSLGFLLQGRRPGLMTDEERRLRPLDVAVVGGQRWLVENRDVEQRQRFGLTNRVRHRMGSVGLTAANLERMEAEVDAELRARWEQGEGPRVDVEWLEPVGDMDGGEGGGAGGQRPDALPRVPRRPAAPLRVAETEAERRQQEERGRRAREGFDLNQLLAAWRQRAQARDLGWLPGRGETAAYTQWRRALAAAHPGDARFAVRAGEHCQLAACDGLGHAWQMCPWLPPEVPRGWLRWEGHGRTLRIREELTDFGHARRERLLEAGTLVLRPTVGAERGHISSMYLDTVPSSCDPVRWPAVRAWERQWTRDRAAAEERARGVEERRAEALAATATTADERRLQVRPAIPVPPVAARRAADEQWAVQRGAEAAVREREGGRGMRAVVEAHADWQVATDVREAAEVWERARQLRVREEQEVAVARARAEWTRDMQLIRTEEHRQQAMQEAMRKEERRIAAERRAAAAAEAAARAAEEAERATALAAARAAEEATRAAAMVQAREGRERRPRVRPATEELPGRGRGVKEPRRHEVVAHMLEEMAPVTTKATPVRTRGDVEARLRQLEASGRLGQLQRRVTGGGAGAGVSGAAAAGSPRAMSGGAGGGEDGTAREEEGSEGKGVKKMEVYLGDAAAPSVLMFALAAAAGGWPESGAGTAFRVTANLLTPVGRGTAGARGLAVRTVLDTGSSVPGVLSARFVHEQGLPAVEPWTGPPVRGLNGAARVLGMYQRARVAVPFGAAGLSQVCDMTLMVVDFPGVHGADLILGAPTLLQYNLLVKYLQDHESGQVGEVVDAQTDELLTIGEDVPEMFAQVKRMEEVVRGWRESGLPDDLVRTLQEYPDVFAGEIAEPATFAPPLQVTFTGEDIQAPVVREVPLAYRDVVREKIKKWVAQGVLRRVQPRDVKLRLNLVVVERPGKDPRVCVDFRCLNPCIEGEEHPLPEVRRVYHTLAGAEDILELDLVAAYNQIEVDPEAARYMAIVVENVAYIPTRVMFGLKTAPGYFQASLRAFVDEHWDHEAYPEGSPMCFIDNLVNWGTSREHLLRRTKALLDIMRLGKIKLNAGVKVGQEITTLGFCVSGKTVRVQPDRLWPLATAEVPRTRRAMRAWRGAVQYVAEHFPGLAVLLEPFNKYMAGHGRIEMTEDEVQRFKNVQDVLGSPEVLHHPVQGRVFHVFTDACDTGFAAMIAQEGTEGETAGIGPQRYLPIAFYAGRFPRRVQQAAVWLKEFNAVRQTLRRYRDMLLGAPLMLHIDNRNVVMMLQAKDPVSARVRVLIQEYGAMVEWVKGEDNVVADYISRHVADLPTTGEAAVVRMMTMQEWVEPAVPKNAGAFLERGGQGGRGGMQVAVVTTRRQGRRGGSAGAGPAGGEATDERTASVTTRQGRRGGSAGEGSVGGEAPEERVMSGAGPAGQEEDEGERREDMGRATAAEGGRQLSEEQRQALGMAHGRTAGHHGLERTVRMLEAAGRQWVGMREDARAWIASCAICQKASGKEISVRATVARVMGGDEVGARWHMDTLGPLERDRNGYQHVLIVVCGFSRWRFARPMREKTAREVVRVLLDICGVFGPPQRIHTDQDVTFMAEVTGTLMRVLGVEVTVAPAGHPASNGGAEASVRLLKFQLRALVQECRGMEFGWGELVPYAQYILNCQPCVATGMSPMDLVLGGRVTAFRGTLGRLRESDEEVTAADAVEELRADLQRLKESARKTQEEYFVRMGEKGVTGQRGSEADLDRGTLVLVRSQTRATGLTFPWRGPFEIVEREGTNRFRVRSVLDEETEKVVHVSDLAVFDGTRTEDIVEEAGADYREFRVERIVTHVGTPRQKRMMRFRVRWLGYGEDDDTWQTWEDLRHTKALREYMAGL